MALPGGSEVMGFRKQVGIPTVTMGGEGFVMVGYEVPDETVAGAAVGRVDETERLLAMVDYSIGCSELPTPVGSRIIDGECR